MEWTPELTEALEHLHSEGHSPREIGQKLGLTRNAVIGKIYRMGLKRAQEVNTTGWRKDISDKAKQLPAKRKGILIRRKQMVSDPIIIAIELERLDQGLSIRDVSQQAGYYENMWSRIVNGNQKASLQCICDIAQVLGMKLEVKVA